MTAPVWDSRARPPYDTVPNKRLYWRLRCWNMFRDAFIRGIGFGAGIIAGALLVIVGTKIVPWFINIFLEAF